MTTEPRRCAPNAVGTPDVAGQGGAHTGPRIVERYGRPVRWFHAGVYLTVLLLLATGWWLLAGNEGDPSPLARLSGVPDARLHTLAGWALTGMAAAGVLLGARAAWTFVVESLRFRASDLCWFASWPAAAFTGRFARHDGHFDPGQRVLNLALVVSVLALVGSGAGLAAVGGGPVFVWLVRVHTWSTYVATPLLIGHVLVAAGVLPGYRGVWRSMHLGGRLHADVAQRLWPGWLERRQGQQPGVRWACRAQDFAPPRGRDAP